MPDSPSSGNRWEPPREESAPFGAVPSGDTTVPSDPASGWRRHLTAARTKVAAAVTVLFLGGGAAGYAVAHATSDDGTGASVPTQPGFGHDGHDHDDGFGEGESAGGGGGVGNGSSGGAS